MSPLPALPPMEGLDAEFYAHCAEGRLCIQRCDGCDTWRHLPRHACAACGSDAWRWQPASGRGRLHSWTVAHRALHPAFAADTPYVIAVVELDEGVRMVAGLRACERGELALDLPLRVDFEPLAEGGALPVFRPAA